MEWKEIQIVFTAVFLIAAVSIVVLCDLLRRKRQALRKAKRRKNFEQVQQRFEQRPRFVEQHRFEQHRFEQQPLEQQARREQPHDEMALVSLAGEIAMLTEAGMREENSAWRKTEPVEKPFLAYKKAPLEFSKPPQQQPLQQPAPQVEPSKALQLLPPPTIDEALFDLLVSGRSAAQRPVESHASLVEALRPSANVAPPSAAAPSLMNVAPPSAKVHFEFTPVVNQPARPKGMIDALELERILRKNKPFTGITVSVSMQGAEGARLSESQLEWVASFVAGLLDENDYSCRNARDEFLIVCPGLQRAEAQQRLNEIAQRLWDFQLRGIGNHSIVFSWGGVEARNESLGDALASAVERMRLNQRSNNRIFVRALTAHNQVV